MSIITDSIDSGKNLLEWLDSENTNTEFYNNAGFCVKFDRCVEGDDSVEIDSDDLTPDINREQLLEYGFCIDSPDEDTYKSKVALYYLSSVHDAKVIEGKLKFMGSILEKTKKNVIVYVCTEDDGSLIMPLYSKKLADVGTKFKNQMASIGVEVNIYGTNLSYEVSKRNYADRCVGGEYTDISHFLPIKSQESLNGLLDFMSENRLCKVTGDIVDNVDAVSCMCLSYGALKNKASVIFISSRGVSSAEDMFVSMCGKLFSRKWDLVSSLRLDLSLFEKLVMYRQGKLQTRGMVYRVTKFFEYTYLPYTAIVSDDVMLTRHVVQPSKRMLGVEDMLPSEDVIVALYGASNNNHSALSRNLRVAQEMCMYCITNRLVPFSDIVWSIVDGELCFGILSGNVGELGIRYVINGSQETTVGTSKNILPLMLYYLDGQTEALLGKQKNKDECVKLCDCDTLSFEFLRLFAGETSTGITVGNLCMAGLFKEIYLLCSNDNIGIYNKLYEEVISTFGKEIIDKLEVNLNGTFNVNFQLSSIV